MTATGISKRGKTKPPRVSKPAKKLRPKAVDGLFTSWLPASNHVNGVRSTHEETSLHFSGLLDQFPAPLVESMRYLVGRFQLGEKVELPRRLGVISALHGEGVTTISRTLSAVIAHDLDVRVCWVDFSWPSPRSAAGTRTARSCRYLRDPQRGSGTGVSIAEDRGSPG